MSSIRRGTIPCLLLIVALSFATVPMQASAQGTPSASSSGAAAPTFLLAPVGQDGTYFTAEQAAGSDVTLTVALGNAGEEDVTARTFAADVYTLINGGFGINPESEPATGTTTWLDYAPETLDLAPGKTVEQEFTVTVPEGTPAGQYITGIVLQTAEPIAVGGSGMLQQIISKAIAVFITVPGPLAPELVIGEASLKQSSIANSLLIELENTGNVLLKPSGTVTVTTGDGEAVLTAPIQMGSVYAGMTTQLELPIPTLLAPGEYIATVALEDAETKLQTEAPALAFTVAAFDASDAPTVAPITIGEVILDPITDAASGDLQVVNVTVPLDNTGPALPSARLTLHVLLDGELVEDFPLNSSLVVATGPTEIQGRYVPLTGWESGTYSFTVILEAVDANSGQTTILASADASTTIDVP